MVTHYPAIATDINRVHEVIKNNVNDGTIPAENSQAIFETIEKHID